MPASKSLEQADIRAFPADKHSGTMPPSPDPEAYAKSGTSGEIQPAAKKSISKRFILSGLLTVAVAAGLWYGYDWWTVGRFMVSTDDAYVQGDIASISPKVTGYIDRIDIVANQEVKAGDILFQLDDGDYKIALDEAEARLATQKQTLARIQAQKLAAEATLQQAEAEQKAAKAVLTNAQATIDRVQKLHATRFVSKAELDNAQSALDQAQAKFDSAEALVASAKANVAVLQAQYDETASVTRSLELARDKAARDLSFTTLRAPFDGVIGNLSAKKGDLVSAGQKIAALVPIHELYVDANYKETQLAHIKPGATAHIRVDAIEGDRFEGKVVSISPASGAVFSLLPPENATGNFTKVVQRVPVRIEVPQEALKTGKIRAGLSVIVDIDTRTSPETDSH
ncbi:HlyD family secretion protein [Daeguia caeni]|uniref:HlyD family secretion protein n=1 Tax=Daeguia caeni TaxID=439612 RepID=A0ABV9H0U1_9HYPH